MKNILIICVSLCALCLIGCGGGSSSSSGGGGNTNSNIVTIDGVTFDKTYSIAWAGPEWTSNDTYNFIGHDGFDGTSYHINLNKGYYVNSVPCIREITYYNEGGLNKDFTYSYYAKGINDHIYILKVNDDIFITPQIIFHKNIGILGTEWELNDPFISDVFTFSVPMIGGVSQYLGWDMYTFVRHSPRDLSFRTSTCYDYDLIPIEIYYEHFISPFAGYFLANDITFGSISAPVGNN